MRLIQPDGKGASQKQPDRSMLSLLVKARRWWERLSEGTMDIRALAREEGVDESWVTRIVRLNFLAPEIVTAILEGNHPATLNSAALSNSGVLPARWDEQLKRFGFN